MCKEYSNKIITTDINNIIYVSDYKHNLFIFFKAGWNLEAIDLTIDWF